MRVIDAAFMTRWGKSSTIPPASAKNPAKGVKATLTDEDILLVLSLMHEVTAKYGIELIEGTRNEYTNQLAILCKEAGLPEVSTAEYAAAEIENRSGYNATETLAVFRCVYASLQIAAPRELPSDDYFIDYDTDYPEPEPMLSYKGVLFASEGNISTIVAKQKVGKSFFTSLIEAGYISGKYGGIEGEAITHDGAVLHFDTEQSALHIARMQKRLYRMLNWGKKSPVVRFYGLREMSVSERVRFIESEALKYLPRLIVVDGAVDLCADFNSIERSNETLHFLMRLSSRLNNHIVTVIHENKGDTNARGHCGSFLMQRSESVIQLTKSKNGDHIDVTFPFTRNRCPEHFCFEIGLDGLPAEICPAGQQSPTQSNYALFAGILKEPMSYAALRTAVMGKKSIGERTAEKHIASARLAEIISKDEAGIYSFKNDFEDEL